MAQREPTNVKNLDQYGNEALPWSRPRDVLNAQDPTADIQYFLNTVRPDGTPHSAGIGALWHDGDFYIVSGPQTRKSRNLAHNPACTISGRLEGIDLVFEGEAHRITDPALLEEVAKRYRDAGWPAEVEGDAFTAPYTAPSGGPPPWHV
jgi:hypothetical protein